MPVHRPAHPARRIALTGAAALTTTLALAGPASAHAEVEADTPQALAENVTLTFVSEAESDSAGFTRLRVVLPGGVAPGDVVLAEAPKGWKFKATSDGYTVAGPALKAGVDAEHKIKVRQLPDAEQIGFKTVETYSDGEVSRWIELSGAGEEAEQPAPVLKLKPAAVGATPVGSAAPSTAPARIEGKDAAADAEPVEKADAAPDEGSSARMVVMGVAAVVLLAGGGAWWLARRRAISGAS
ncbi:DUF1775 domain-containing protein [Streptomyces sp. NBC_01728]|uniref:DUF1775 domain-containing protein n=1 Tax=unclassified Streptomyces TaxID=2593676 RepID=UPI002254259E|nr:MULTISPECIES: DUF1775 domain-containing protein [unclassified Streptomyces]MCX4452370.1 DUF1775 domain-containing protein [Streptomyces sp. NBC_01719]MCX4491730.1 DUF1775 domain-containing protein [Streptomyces sp. NBC_01728]